MAWITKVGGEISAVYSWKVDGSELIADDHLDVVAFLNPPVPTPPLSPRQLRLGLLSTGTTEADVDALITAMPDPAEKAWSQIEWKYATSFDRNHPLIVSFGPALGFSEAEIDALWSWALDL